MGQSWCGSSQKEIKERERSEQLFCPYCEIAFVYDWHVEYENCPKCGNDSAK